MLVGLILFICSLFCFILIGLVKRFNNKFYEMYCHFEKQLDQKQDLIRMLELKLEIFERELFKQKELKQIIIDKLDYMTNENKINNI